MLPVLLLGLLDSLHTAEGNTVNFMQEELDTTNWTNCEEFLNNTSLDLDSVIDVDWKIFYFWSIHTEKSYHIRFSRPSPMLVDRFRLELNNDIQPAVNWSHSELFLETSIDLSGLFIKTNVSGQFRFIPSFAFRFHFSPWLIFAMKIMDGYMALMNCKQKFVYALAPVEKVPSPLKIEEIAARFGIQNPYGRSYLTKAMPYEVTPNSVQKYLDDNRDPDDYATVELAQGLMF